MSAAASGPTSDGGAELDGAAAKDAGLTTRLSGLTGVVVGDDGSACAREAVTWAAQAARGWGAPLHIVRAWRLVTAPRPQSWSPGYAPPLREWEESVRDDLRSAWASLARDVPGLQLHAVHGDPVRVLVDASDGADVVVVGSRGHGALHQLLLGSVAEEVARQAHSPVVIVRNTGSGRRGTAQAEATSGDAATP